MRRLSLRLKKFKQNLGVVNILFLFAYGSSKEQIAEARRKGEENTFQKEVIQIRTRVFIGIVEYGPTVGEPKWDYPYLIQKLVPIHLKPQVTAALIMQS